MGGHGTVIPTWAGVIRKTKEFTGQSRIAAVRTIIARKRTIKVDNGRGKYTVITYPPAYSNNVYK